MILLNLIIYWFLTRAILHNFKTKKGVHNSLSRKPEKTSFDVDDKAEMSINFHYDNEDGVARTNLHLEFETDDVSDDTFLPDEETLQNIEELLVENHDKLNDEQINDILVSENGTILDNDKRFRYYFSSNPFLNKSNVSKPIYDNTKNEDIGSTIEEIRKNVSEMTNGNNEQIGIIDIEPDYINITNEMINTTKNDLNHQHKIGTEADVATLSTFNLSSILIFGPIGFVGLIVLFATLMNKRI